MPSEVTKVQVTSDSVRVPRVVLGLNAEGQEVYLYYDSALGKVVISGCIGIAYEQRSETSGSTFYILDVTNPNL